MERLIAATRRRLGLAAVAAPVFAGLVLLVGALPAAADTTPQTLPFAQDWSNTGLITANDTLDRRSRRRRLPRPGHHARDRHRPADPPHRLPRRKRRRRDREPVEHGDHERRRRRVRRDRRPRRRAPGLRHRRRAAPSPHPQHHRARQRLRRLQPARHRRHGRQRRPAGRAPVPHRLVAAATRTFRPASSPTPPPGRASQRSSRPSTSPLPAAVDNQPVVQIRVITSNAVGNDEWVGVDDISVTAAAADQAPAVQIDLAGERRRRRRGRRERLAHLQRAGERHRQLVHDLVLELRRARRGA